MRYQAPLLALGFAAVGAVAGVLAACGHNADRVPAVPLEITGKVVEELPGQLHAGSCATSLRWTVSPLALKGGPASGRAVETTVDYIGVAPSTRSATTDEQCVFLAPPTGPLQRGTWRVTVSDSDGWSATCDRDISALEAVLGSEAVAEFDRDNKGCAA